MCARILNEKLMIVHYQIVQGGFWGEIDNGDCTIVQYQRLEGLVIRRYFSTFNGFKLSTDLYFWVVWSQKFIKSPAIRLFSSVENFRSSRPEVFCKKGVLKNFTKFTGKHLCKSPFFNITLLKKRLWHRCFPVNFVKFLRTSFFLEHL